MHSGELPYQCEYCGKRFRRKDHVIKHSKIHENSETDEDAGTTAGNTRRTVRKRRRPAGSRKIPQVDVPLVCTVCNKKFKSAVFLRCHMRKIHKILSLENNKKFKCRRCDAVFVFRKSRVEHEKLHADPVNKFQCPVCWARMEEETDLQGHMKLHEGSNSFTCNTCMEMFPDILSLDAHVYAEHYREGEAEEGEGGDVKGEDCDDRGEGYGDGGEVLEVVWDG